MRVVLERKVPAGKQADLACGSHAQTALISRRLDF
jgi:hypothetical protein